MYFYWALFYNKESMSTEANCTKLFILGLGLSSVREAKTPAVCMVFTMIKNIANNFLPGSNFFIMLFT